MAASAADGRKRTGRAGLLAPVILLFATGCQTASLEEVAPLPARLAAETDAGTTAAPSIEPSTSAYVAPPDTSPRPGDYPNLNIPMQSAAPVLSDAETRQGKARLEAARRGNAAAPAPLSPSPSPSEMRRLARERLEETLRRIEAE